MSDDLASGVERFTLAAFQEACRIVAENVATVADVDIALRAGAGFKEGIFAWADEQGLAQLHQRLEQMAQVHGEWFAPLPLLTQRVASGRGFTDV
ncbi:MAG: 3-hydroxyacyl-CoA dehydrogenase family protein [Sulfobacillus sp.]